MLLVDFICLLLNWLFIWCLSDCCGLHVISCDQNVMWSKFVLSYWPGNTNIFNYHNLQLIQFNYYRNQCRPKCKARLTTFDQYVIREQPHCHGTEIWYVHKAQSLGWRVTDHISHPEILSAWLETKLACKAPILGYGLFTLYMRCVKIQV